jgi:hypothetical protein
MIRVVLEHAAEAISAIAKKAADSSSGNWVFTAAIAAANRWRLARTLPSASSSFAAFTHARSRGVKRSGAGIRDRNCCAAPTSSSPHSSLHMLIAAPQ